MKRAGVVFVGVSILLLVFLIIWARFSSETKKEPPAIKTAFLNCTKSPYGDPEMLFLFTNYSDQVSWSVFQLNEITNKGLKSGALPTVYRIYATNNPLPPSFTVGVPIPTSNSAWQIIFQFRERAPGLQGLFDRNLEKCEKLFNGTYTERYNGRFYFTTNETVQ